MTPAIRLAECPRCQPLVVSYGGGVNSTAMLIGMRQRDIVPDLILFADTGGEKPETYSYIKHFDGWLTANGMPSITLCRYESKHGTLEQECRNNGTLPGLAFGFKGCSVKWKRQPMDRAAKEFTGGKPCIRAIGIHVGESHRGKMEPHKLFTWVFSVIEWGWDQAACVKAIQDAGLCVPPKSACFYCPAAKKHEVIELSQSHPDLMERAIAMEQNARERGGLKTIKGLGRHWSWEALVSADQSQQKLFEDWGPPESPCMCWDG